MAFYITAGPFTSATPVVTRMRLSDGYTYDQNAEAFAATPAFDDCKYLLTAGPATFNGSMYYGTIDAASIEGELLIVHDDGDANNKAIGGVASVVRATDASGNALANPGDQMDLVNAPNATAVTAIQDGLATSAQAVAIQGATFDTATDSLEALANGSASTSLTITPLSATINSDVLTSYDLTVGQHCAKSWTIAVTDSEGEPVNLSGKTVKVGLWRDSAPQTAVATLTTSVSGTDNNNITFSVSATNTATAEMLRFTAQNTTDDQELLEGTITIKARPNVT